jgi:hypothetical protein
MLNAASAPEVPGGTNAPPQDIPPQLLPPGTAPTNGTFYFLVETNWPPLPFAPCAGCDIYALSDGSYLVDDTSYSWPEPGTDSGGIQPGPRSYTTSDLWLEMVGVTNSLANLILHGTVSGTAYTLLSRQSWSTNDPWDAEQPLIGAAEQDWTPVQVPTFGRRILFFRALVGVATPTRLWLYPVGISNNCFNVVLHGTTEDTSYDIRSTMALSATNNWVTETSFSGATGQFWTPVSIPLSGRQNLFLSARSWMDSSGAAIPDWWQIQYFGAVGIDPYSDPAGDGWTALQDYINGWNPTNYHTPPALQGVYLGSDSSGDNVVRWNSPAVTPDTFTIQRNTGSGWQMIATVAGNLSSYTDVNPPASASYQAKANYRNGSSAYAMAGSHGNLDPSLTLPATIASGPGGRLFLLTATPSTTVTGLVITVSSAPSDHPKDGIESVVPQYPYTNFYGINHDVSGVLSATSLQGSPLRLSTGFTPAYGSYQFWLQTLATNGTMGNPVQAAGSADATPFLDGRQHMLDNLDFALRAAPGSQPFDFYFPVEQYVGAGACYGIFPAYTTAGFSWAFADSDNVLLRQDVLDPFLPFENDSVLRAFCFTTNRFNPYGNPLDVGYDGLPVMNTWNYYFSSFAWAQSGNTNVPPRQLDSDTAQYIFYGSAIDQEDVPDLGLAWDETIPGWRLNPNARNVYGLRILSVLCAKVTQTPQPLTCFTAPAGGIIPAMGTTNQPGSGWLYVQAEAPGFQKAGFHFIPFDNSSSPALCGPGWYAWTGVPNTNSLVATVGTQSSFYLWTRLVVTNAYPNTVCYLQDYFDKAYKMDASGGATTNQTGLLSEYGSFFPTEPGPVALVTKPDLATGQTCTGVVQVISLNVDANHDGVLDPTYYGSDFTSLDKPYVFWINNDRDLPDAGAGHDVQIPPPPYRTPGVPVSDCDFGNIGCQRNLEDFARLWACGLPKLPPSQGYTVTLTMSPSSGSPAINLYAAITNSADYLSSTKTAAAQFTQVYLNDQLMMDYSKKLGTVSAIQSYSLPLSSDGTLQYTNFLFEGAGIGAGQLKLTISQTTTQGSNVLAQTSMWLDLHDVRDFYERTILTNSVYNPIAVQQTGIERTEYASSTALGEDKDIIVLVHGFNVGYGDWLLESDTVFKRLYWAGYHGKFISVHWPCKMLDSDIATFNISESEAYTASASMAVYLGQLRARYPNHRLHLLVHSQGNAVVSEAIRNGAPFDTYILTQAAIPASAYDINAPLDADLVAAEVPPNFTTPDWQPMGYHGIYTNFPGQSGKIVSYFNPVDFALATGRFLGLNENWKINQERYKPSPGYSYDGTNGWNTPIGYPQYRVDDSRESRSMIARSRTMAVGALAGVSGVIRNTVNLQTQFGFGSALDEHSGQWMRPIQTSLPYYIQVLQSINP